MEIDSVKQGMYDYENIAIGAAAGLAGGAAFGVVIELFLGVFPAIGALYTGGAPNMMVGYLAHGFHSVVLGALFVGLASLPKIRQAFRSYVGSAGVGLFWGLATWFVGAGLAMPAWLQAVGFPPAPSVPNLQVGSLAGHLLFGLVAGLGYRFGLERTED
jgi:hypothetical protein